MTARTLRNGWLHTGDGAYMDEEGFIFIVDRVKDMIISGGENVYSAETEEALYSHKAVVECAVIGVPDETWGERVHAIVRLKPGMTATPDELIAHCHTLIAGYKCPRTIESAGGTVAVVRRRQNPQDGPAQAVLGGQGSAGELRQLVQRPGQRGCALFNECLTAFGGIFG